MAARQSDLKCLIDKDKKGVRLFSAANSNFDLILIFIYHSNHGK